MCRPTLKMIGAAFLGFGLAACSHSGHQPMMSARGQKLGCTMMQQGADGSHPGKMGEKDKGQTMAMDCPMMGGMNMPKADVKQPTADDGETPIEKGACLILDSAPAYLCAY